MARADVVRAGEVLRGSFCWLSGGYLLTSPAKRRRRWVIGSALATLKSVRLGSVSCICIGCAETALIYVADRCLNIVVMRLEEDLLNFPGRELTTRHLVLIEPVLPLLTGLVSLQGLASRPVLVSLRCVGFAQ